MTKKEQRDNQRAIEHAIAQQALEGLAITPETLASLQRVAKGELESSDLINILYARYAKIPVSKFLT